MSKADKLIPIVPTQQGDMGIRYDFLCGCRILLPHGNDDFHVCVMDAETATVFIDEDFPAGARVFTRQKYFIPYILTVRNLRTGQEWRHVFDLHGKSVAMFVLVSTIGDICAWLPMIERFRVLHGREVYAAFESPIFKPLFRKAYPGIKFVSSRTAGKLGAYAGYMMGITWGDDGALMPFDHRLVGLAQSVGLMLGVDPTPAPVRLDLRAQRRISEPYVCIAVQSSTLSKNWLYPGGWRDVVHTLKKCGYRVLCIDRDREVGDGENVMRMPDNAEDFTGDKPLQERVDLIKDADFFIGLSSGLAWLAWGCGVPVVMIGGFTEPNTEFPCYRVLNKHFCHGCWNDTRHKFDSENWAWCPRHQGTEREHECGKWITPEQVFRMIMRIPAFRKHMEVYNG